MKRSPAAAVWLSLLPGLGHIYVGLVGKGFLILLLFAGTIHLVEHGSGPLGIFIPAILLYSMVDAHRSAVEVNRIVASGGALPPTIDVGFGKVWGYVLIGLGVLFTLENFDLIDFEWLWNLWPLGFIALGVYILRRRTTPLPPSAPPLSDESPTIRSQAGASPEELASEEPGNV